MRRQRADDLPTGQVVLVGEFWMLLGSDHGNRRVLYKLRDFVLHFRAFTRNSWVEKRALSGRSILVAMSNPLDAPRSRRPVARPGWFGILESVFRPKNRV